MARRCVRRSDAGLVYRTSSVLVSRIPWVVASVHVSNSTVRSVRPARRAADGLETVFLVEPNRSLVGAVAPGFSSGRQSFRARVAVRSISSFRGRRFPIRSGAARSKTSGASPTPVVVDGIGRDRNLAGVRPDTVYLCLDDVTVVCEFVSVDSCQVLLVRCLSTST